MKIGRNAPCPCGSGRKYKKCCLGKTAQPPQIPAEVWKAFVRHRDGEAERLRRFGHVRAPIFTEVAGYKVVAVGSRLMWDKNWKTFHDFLFTYIAGGVFGKEWGDGEIVKPFEERHPIAQWYQRLCELQARYAEQRTGDGTYEALATGPVMAYLSLAYDLYTLEHHALLRDVLIKRLKVKDQFQGARYETYVAAAFVRAGFDVVLEDETDTSTSHCEFVATHRASGARYSVEAKSRHRPGFLGVAGTPKPLAEIEANISSLLVKALRKRADHERIVFIDVNVPREEGLIFEADWFKKIAGQVHRLEESLRGDHALPAAFIIFTNHPYHYVGDDAPEPGRTALFTGINIPEFGMLDPNLIERKFPAVYALFQSVTQHVEVPREFP